VAEVGEMVSLGSGDVSLRVKVQAPCWIPVEEVRFFANGEPIHRVAVASECSSVVRFEGELRLRPAEDTHYVVEAGQSFPDTPGELPQPPAGTMSILEPDVVSLAFTNPVFIDVNGNGLFDPPGVAPLVSGVEMASPKREAVSLPRRTEELKSIRGSLDDRRRPAAEAGLAPPVARERRAVVSP
jgi:hypothetical protein